MIANNSAYEKSAFFPSSSTSDSYFKTCYHEIYEISFSNPSIYPHSRQVLSWRPWNGNEDIFCGGEVAVIKKILEFFPANHRLRRRSALYASTSAPANPIIQPCHSGHSI